MLQALDGQGAPCYYVGESDAIVKRLQYHRRAIPKRFGCKVHSAAVVGLPAREKSTAKLIERNLQRQLFAQVCARALPLPGAAVQRMLV